MIKFLKNNEKCRDDYGWMLEVGGWKYVLGAAVDGGVKWWCNGQVLKLLGRDKSHEPIEQVFPFLSTENFR